MPLAGRMRLNTFLAMIAAGSAVCGTGGLIVSSILGWSLWPEPTAPEVPAPRSQPIKTIAAAADTHEVVVMGYVGQDIGTSKRKDVTSGRSFKVNVYQDDGQSTVNRAKVDLDRDDKWDEKWTVDGASITRQVAPADDENYTVEQTWSGTAWQ